MRGSPGQTQIRTDSRTGVRTGAPTSAAIHTANTSHSRLRSDIARRDFTATHLHRRLWGGPRNTNGALLSIRGSGRLRAEAEPMAPFCSLVRSAAGPSWATERRCRSSEAKTCRFPHVAANLRTNSRLQMGSCPRQRVRRGPADDDVGAGQGSRPGIGFSAVSSPPTCTLIWPNSGSWVE